MTYGVIAVERAMKLQEVMLRAMSGELSWLQAADILGMHPRSLRRWRARQQRVGYTACWIGGGSALRPAWRRSMKSSASCGSIGTATAASTCGTSISSSGAMRR
jgi:hypothetical protein